MAKIKPPVIYRVRNNQTGLYLNSNGVWGLMGRIFEKRGSAESHLTHYSRTPKKERQTDTGRILNCTDEWVDVEVVASKLVDISSQEYEIWKNELLKEQK
jgi:hypothetical protein